MKRFKHILAATDLSSESFSAVSYAGHLAKAQAAKLTVLYVAHSTALLFSEFAPAVNMVALDDEVERLAYEQLESWVRRHLRGVAKVDVMVRRGETHLTICEVADDLDVSVIVMATHGRKGLGHAVLGSVTEKVLRDAPCPVLVVKPPAPTITVKGRKGTKAAKSAKRA